MLDCALSFPKTSRCVFPMRRSQARRAQGRGHLHWEPDRLPSNRPPEVDDRAVSMAMGAPHPRPSFLPTGGPEPPHLYGLLSLVVRSGGVTPFPAACG